MIPENRESSTPIVSDLMSPDQLHEGLLIDYEMGGVDINDGSQGLRVKTWQFYVDADTIYCIAEGVLPFEVVTWENITEISGTFDQNMRPVVAYVANDLCHLNWYDTWTNTRRDYLYPGCIGPKLALDDKRSIQFENSDIIFAYLRAGKLCYRQQRDRYGVERVVRENATAHRRVKKFGMNRGYRLQFELE